jgi:hypothetical protein
LHSEIWGELGKLNKALLGLQKLQFLETRPFLDAIQIPKFFHFLSITSIFSRVYGVLNIDKK